MGTSAHQVQGNVTAGQQHQKWTLGLIHLVAGEKQCHQVGVVVCLAWAVAMKANLWKCAAGRLWWETAEL